MANFCPTAQDLVEGKIVAVRVLPEDSDTESAEVSDSRIRVLDGIVFLKWWQI